MPIITTATLEDTDALSSLLSLLMKQETDFITDEEAQKRGLGAIIQNPEMGSIIKLEIKSELVGMINILYSISTAIGAKVAIFEDFIVAPAFRSKGFGRLLFQQAELHARASGCQRITLLTDRNNKDAHRFYKQQGMEGSGMTPFRKSL